MGTERDSDSIGDAKAFAEDDTQRYVSKLASLDSVRGLWGNLLHRLSIRLPWHQREAEKREQINSRRRSMEIDKYLEAESQRAKYEPYVYIFGGRDITEIVWKKARLLSNPLKQQEKMELRDEIREYVFKALRGLTDCVSKESDLETRELLQNLAKECDEVMDNRDAWTDQKFDTLKTNLFSEIYCERMNQLVISAADSGYIGNLESFLNCSVCADGRLLVGLMDRLCTSDYEPTEHDWFHFDAMSYFRTLETQVFADPLTIRFLRMKWGCCSQRLRQRLLDAIHCAIHVVDLGVYDMFLPEDESYSRLRDDMALFGSLASSKRFAGIPLLLLFTNVSVFKQKLPKKPLGVIFPEYMHQGTADEALTYIRDRYNEMAAGKSNLGVYISNLDSSTEMAEMFEHLKTNCFLMC
jgi:guanine nucleotide-binding protein subunit alpha